MNLFKKTTSVVMAMAIIFLQGVTAFAAETTTNIAGEPIDRSGQVTRIDIPNGDGTFRSLEGAEAQAWYVQAVAESEQRLVQEATVKDRNIESERDVEPKGSFHYKYRYIQSRRTNDVERTELEKTVTNKLRNTTSSPQSYTLSLSVSQSSSVSPSVTGEYKKAIKAGISGSWGNTYSKSESFTVNVAPNKTVWVTFIPIMDKSQGKVQKYFIPRGGISKKPVIEKSYDIVTYNPKYLTSKMGPFTFKTVYGVYVWHEK